MAKKASKTNSKTAPQKKSPSTKNTKANASKKSAEVKKTAPKKEVKVRKPLDQEKVSRIVSGIFISVGILLIGVGIFSYIKYRQTPELDSELESPSIVGINKLTNGDEIVIKGVANDFDEVFVYVDGEKVQTVKVDKEDTFETVYEVDSEGEYSVSVAGVRGFPRRYISEISLSEDVVIDWTAPDVAEMDYSPEVGTEYFTVIGSAEPGAEISVKRGVDSYSAIADGEGVFRVPNIMLEEGANVFNVEVKDLAGNTGKLEEKIRVTYSPDSDVNGDAISDMVDGELPVAAGELEDAMAYIFGNNLMIIFGLIALVAFSTSSVVMYKKYNA